MIALIVAAISSHQGGPKAWDLNFGESDVVIRNAPIRHYHFDNEKGTLDLNLEGNPAEAEFNSRGAKLNGRSIVASVLQQADGIYKLESADVTGGAKVTMNTDAQVAFLKSKGKTLNVPIASRAELTSERITLGTVGEKQTLTLPSKFVLDGFRAGIAISKDAPPVPFEEESHVDGASGTFDLLLVQPDGTYQFQTGSIVGPVHYHVVRTEHRSGQPKPVVNTYDLTADKLVFDFTKPEGIVTATGNVHWQQTGEMNLEGYDDQTVATTDQNHKIQSITGITTKTIAIPPKGGGRA